MKRPHSHSPPSSARTQFLALAASRMLAAAVQAAVGIWLARSVMPDQYGVVTAVAGAALLWFILCDFGVSSHIGRLRAIGTREEVESALLANVLCAALGSVVAVVATLFVPAGVAAVPTAVLILVVLAQAIDKNIDGAVAVPVADGETTFPAVSALLRRAVTAVCFFSMLAGSVDALISYGVSAVAGPLAGQLHTRTRLSALGLRLAGVTRVIPLLRRSLLFGVNDVAIQSRGLDVTVVAIVSGPTLAGTYAAAVKLVSPFHLVTSTLANVVLPRAARSDATTIRRTAIVMVLGASVLLVPCAAIAASAGDILVLVVGAQYSAAASALALMVVTLPFVALATPLASLVQGSGRERWVAVNSAVFAVAILVGVAIGALWGVTGAAVGFAVASVLKVLALFAELLRLGRVEADGSDVR